MPVCAETVDEFVADIKRAAEFADVIELRFDSLLKGELVILDKEISNAVLSRIYEQNYGKEILTTFRTKEQGGYREISEEEREHFWDMGYDSGGADCEEDAIENSFYWLWDPRICSYHDFKEVPANLPEIYARLKDSLADIVKIAVQTNDITDGLPLWKLINQTDPGTFIPIAMGEAGKWTRIMGPAFGAPLTYASMEDGRGNAPGQISARDLIEVYRVKKLTPKTKVYAIIGNPVSKSLSPYMQNAAFREKGLDAVFIPMEVKDLGRFMREFIRGSGLNFGGFAVTMPHKETIIPYLDEIDETAKAVGAVNTVKFENGKLNGFNTDIDGILEPLRMEYGDLSGARVAVLGAGGAARAAVYALKKESAEITIFARDAKKGGKLSKTFGPKSLPMPVKELNDFDIVINATPLGMKPGQENLSLIKADAFGDVKVVFDLVTVPAETGLIKQAKQAGIRTIGGVEMLIAQGIKQFEIWTGLEAPEKEMRSSAITRR